MDCHDIRKNLSDFLESELTQEQSAEIRTHLASCRPCTQEMKRHLATWKTLGKWKEIEPSPHFKQRFWSKIAEIENQKRSKAWLHWDWRPAWRIPLGSAAAVLLVTLTWFLWPSAERERQVAQSDKNNSLVELVTSLDLIEDKEVLAEMDLLQDESFDLLLSLEESNPTLGRGG